jgi:Ca2+-dependent lipid-binding protein
MDPYVVLTLRSHEQKSTVAKGNIHPSAYHVVTVSSLLVSEINHLNSVSATGTTGAGSEPEWNETFVVRVFGSADNSPELSIKIMDSDNFSADDLVGEARQAPYYPSTTFPEYDSCRKFRAHVNFSELAHSVSEL